MVSGGNERVPLIYNGQGYARGDWPWLVAIYKRKDGSLSFACSGTLVSDRHVVTGEYLSIFYLMTNKSIRCMTHWIYLSANAH